jgi:hypothetical protein
VAVFSLTDAFVLLNAVNMSAMAKKVTCHASVAELETTPFSSTYRIRIGGLKDYTLDIQWNQDFAAAQTDALLFPLLGTVVTFEVRPTSAGRSATNPAYTGSVLVSDYLALDSGVGDLADMQTSWKGAAPLLRQIA